MTDIEFWELIALIDVSALEGGEKIRPSSRCRLC